MLTIADIKKNEEINNYISKADKALKEMGYTEHALPHVERCVKLVHDVLEKLGYNEDTIRLGEIAAFMHDIGNVINRIDHAQSGAMMSFVILNKLGMDSVSISQIISSIGNHDESTAYPVSAISAALILADKSDVRRSRVREIDKSEFDIHDRVNYAVKKKRVAFDGTEFVLSLDIDDNICSIMDYFEIFMKRMLLCKQASKFLGIKFVLEINGTKMI